MAATSRLAEGEEREINSVIRVVSAILLGRTPKLFGYIYIYTSISIELSLLEAMCPSYTAFQFRFRIQVENLTLRATA